MSFTNIPSSPPFYDERRKYVIHFFTMKAHFLQKSEVEGIMNADFRLKAKSVPVSG